MIVQRYEYSGPIYVFDKLYSLNWVSETTARSKNEAMRNFLYKAKKKIGLKETARVKI